jgi:hypothetical protein
LIAALWTLLSESNTILNPSVLISMTSSLQSDVTNLFASWFCPLYIWFPIMNWMRNRNHTEEQIFFTLY